MKSKTCKACPHCQSPAPLTAQQCLTCGHAYRTLFVTDASAASSKQPTRKIIVTDQNSGRLREMHPFQTSLLLGFMILLIGGVNIVLQTPSTRTSAYHRHELTRKHLKQHSARPLIMVHL